MAGDERLAERLPARDVDDAVDDAGPLTHRSRQPHAAPLRSSAQKVEHADPAGADAPDELAKERQAASRRKTLEEQIRIDEVELARRGRELRRRLEVNVAHILLRRFTPRDGEHGWRAIDRR